MSLRVRLTLLYTGLLGSILLVLGVLVYGLVRIILLDQVDTVLAESSQQIIERLRVNDSNQFDPRSISEFQLTENLLFQVWGNGRSLQLSRPIWLESALDENGSMAGKPTYTTTQYGQDRLRVLSVPLVTPRMSVGVLQVGVNLHLVDVALSSLATVLVTLSLLFMSISALATWLVTGRALAPLETATRIATSITKADDLQRRIPLSGSSENEVNQLITAFNQTLERLEQLFNAQRRFLADVSHELRTPLTVIRGNVGLMRQMSELDEESLLGIETEVDRLSRMVGDLLLLAQAESGKLPLAMDPVALDTILLDVLQQMKLLNKGKLDIHLTDIDQIQVLGDADRLKQLLLNIIGNAVQYTPAKGRVLVGMRKVLVRDAEIKFRRYQEKLDRAANEVKDNLTNRIIESTSQFNEGFNKLKVDTREAIVNTAAMVKQRVENGLIRYNTKVQQGADKIPGNFSEKASRYPWVTVSIALVIGLLLGNLLKPRR
jgi:signal transduction histidine kinase